MANPREHDFNSISKHSLDMLTDLLNPMLDFAKEQLEKHGEFLPFGAYLDSEDELRLAMLEEDVEASDADEYVWQLASCLAQSVGEGRDRAAVFCVNCRVLPPGYSEMSDALCIHFEDQLGERWDLFFPYRSNKDSTVEYQPWYYEYGDARIFSGKC